MAHRKDLVKLEHPQLKEILVTLNAMKLNPQKESDEDDEKVNVVTCKVAGEGWIEYEASNSTETNGKGRYLGWAYVENGTFFVTFQKFSLRHTQRFDKSIFNNNNSHVPDDIKVVIREHYVARHPNERSAFVITSRQNPNQKMIFYAATGNAVEEWLESLFSVSISHQTSDQVPNVDLNSVTVYSVLKHGHKSKVHSYLPPYFLMCRDYWLNTTQPRF